MTGLAQQQSCSICMSTIEAYDGVHECSSCHASYHEDCWSDNGGCAIYGCAHVPKVEGLRQIEIPPAFWGREDKKCPRCGATIIALATRCRHCGAEFGEAPEAKEAFDRRAARTSRVPRYRRAALAFVVMSILPFVSLVTLVAGSIYYRANRDEIARVPGGAQGLYRIAIGTAAAQFAFLLAGVVAWWVKLTIEA